MHSLAAALLFGCFLLPGCAYMSKSGRQQMAYQRYVKRCEKTKYRQRVKITKQQQKIPDYRPSKYDVHAEKVDSPQPVTTGESSGESHGEQ